jgi:pimeloyl-ACP methyl ester carboxylesterase
VNNLFFIEDNGCDDYVVLLPGWGFCHEIFAGLDLPFNMILPVAPIAFDISEALENFLDTHSIRRVLMVGWSMGGLQAWEASKRLSEKTVSLCLVSVRNFYSAEEISIMKRELASDLHGAMYKFYRLCFAGSPPDRFRFFRERQMETFMARWGPKLLDMGLDMLEQRRIREDVRPVCDTTLFYGDKDMLVSKKQRLNIGGASVVEIRRGGHMPFFYPEFCDHLGKMWANGLD